MPSFRRSASYDNKVKVLTDWFNSFLEAQGHVTDKLLNQDNTSSTQLENCGKASSSQCVGHMHVQHFLLLAEC